MHCTERLLTCGNQILAAPTDTTTLTQVATAAAAAAAAVTAAACAGVLVAAGPSDIDRMAAAVLSS